MSNRPATITDHPPGIAATILVNIVLLALAVEKVRRGRKALRYHINAPFSTGIVNSTIAYRPLITASGG